MRPHVYLRLSLQSVDERRIRGYRHPDILWAQRLEQYLY